MLTANQLRQKYLDFFASKGHAVIPSAPLVPENDPTTLFTSSGMQPLIGNLLGQPHPSGKRLVDSQKSFRSQDIEEVGDNRHTTFFEMLGNWSLGDYFKQEQLAWFFEFLTKEVKINPEKLYVTVFSGDSSTGIEKDEESISIWKKLFKEVYIDAEYIELDTEDNGAKVGMKNGRIFGYGVKKNWWSRSGIPSNMPVGEPGGPDSEMFYDFGTEHDPKYGEKCHPNCDCGRFLEIGNSVFMQYFKQEDGSLKELPQKNVDFGGGLERILAAANNDSDVFQTDLFINTIKEIEKLTNTLYDEESKVKFRIITDHLKASIFIISDGVRPSNQKQGYVLRRLIRRSIVVLAGLKQIKAADLLSQGYLFEEIVSQIVNLYKYQYKYIESKSNEINEVLKEEWEKFNLNMKSAYPHIMKLMERDEKIITGEEAFYLFESHGVLPVVLEEVATRYNKFVNWERFKELQSEHQDLSRTAGKGLFRGGLEEHSETTTKYHTATHLLQAALRQVLGTHVSQKGSNITAERLRFDFSHTEKMTPDQIKAVEDLMNEKIAENIPVARVEMKKADAIAEGAMAFFPEKYPDVTSVYTIGTFSKELCGGPHVNSTGEIGGIKIIKEESASSGIRRIYAQLK